MASLDEPVEGQFDDAPESFNGIPMVLNNALPSSNPREGHQFIDDDVRDGILEWSEPEGEEEGEDNLEPEEDYDNDRVEDEDWEMAERDFTKQYNRLKQHVAVRTGQIKNVPSSASAPSVAALPAVNRPRKTTVTEQRDKTADQLGALSKYSSRLSKIDTPYEGMGVGINRKGPSSYANMKDKSDRATSEQVLDPRTRIILFKMIGRGLIQEVNGCVSTGKEANVYHALAPDHQHLALKIYKTSILVFKDRDRYVSGEHRFRRGYSRHNPRKMVRLWAEKEVRNLKRLVSAGIRCPEPLEVRENVLVMNFLGDEEGWASPRLKDADIPASAFQSLYPELVCTIRKMNWQCKLVHADLSEYNILYHNGHLYIIDVSQSVEHDHPHAFDFLRNDIKNVEEFFENRGCRCLGLRRCFEFVTREKVCDKDSETDEEVLDRWLDETHSNDARTKDHEDAVFFQSWIPRTLNEVYDPERDVEALGRGEGKNLIYADTIGIVSPHGDEAPKEGTKAVRFEDDDDEEQDEEEEQGDGGDEEGESDSSDNSFQERKPRGHRHEDKEAKKERKKAVKAEVREKRKQKMPKAEKKRKVKNTRR